MADTLETQNQDQAQVQPAPASEPAPVAQPATVSEPIPVAQPVVATPESQSAPVAQPVAQPVVATPVTQPAVPTPATQPDSTVQTQPVQTNADTSNERKTWPIWLMASFAFLLILCWIITICAPGVYWTFMDIILWIVLVLAWISRIINAFTNEKEHSWCLLSIIWVLAVVLWFIVMFSGAEFVWTLSIWAIAIWAFLRWCILIYYSLSNKEQQKFWRWILALWILLIILFFVIAFSDKDEARAIVWICIWISTVLDWLCLLFLSFRVNNDPSLQDKMLEQANQSEIAQWDVNTANPTIQTPNNEIQQSVTVAQPAWEIQPWTVQQPIVAPVAQQVAVAQPTTTEPATQPEVQTPTTNVEPVQVDQPITETQPAPATDSTTMVQPEAQDSEVQPAEDVQTPAEENKPAEDVQTPAV